MEQELIKDALDAEPKISKSQSLEEWAAMIRDVYERKEPIDAFCKRNGIRSSDFYWYRKKCINQGLIEQIILPKTQSKTSEKKEDLPFAKIDPKMMKQETNTDESLTICKNGWEIRLNESFNETILMRVMKVMNDA